MAIKDLIRNTDRMDEGRVENAPMRQSPPRTVAPATSIDASSDLSGKLRCKETIRIDGRVKGEVTCEKTVIVVTSSWIDSRERSNDS